MNIMTFIKKIPIQHYPILLVYVALFIYAFLRSYYLVFARKLPNTSLFSIVFFCNRDSLRLILIKDTKKGGACRHCLPQQR